MLQNTMRGKKFFEIAVKNLNSASYCNLTIKFVFQVFRFLLHCSSLWTSNWKLFVVADFDFGSGIPQA